MPNLVINADDFGYCFDRNKGIVDCFLGGGISSASLLVNGYAAESAVAQAKAHHLPIGLHINITEGLAVNPETRCSTLVNENGKFHGKMAFRQKYLCGMIKDIDIVNEINAQVDLFVKLTGECPFHADGHQHFHVLPGVNKVFADVLSKNGIHYTRLPFEGNLCECSWFHSDFCLEVSCQAYESKPVFDMAKLRYTDSFVGLSTMGKNMTVEHLQQRLMDGFSFHKNYAKRDTSCELMVHPGLPATSSSGGCGDGCDDFAMSYDRQHELSVLCTKEIFKFYHDKKIKLVSFQELLQ